MRITLNYVWGMRQSSAYDEEGGEFSPPTATNERLTCDLLIAGGGLSGLSAAEAALQRGLDPQPEIMLGGLATGAADIHVPVVDASAVDASAG